MMQADYRELLTAVAASAGALTGLLFVALSVAPRRGPALGPQVIRQVRAAAALLAFTNALSVSLFSLVPGTNVGYPSVVLGVIGVFFTAASVRSIASSPATGSQIRGQLGLIILLLLIFGTELVSGIVALARPGQTGPQDVIGYALVASLLVGISRAWELVGDIDTGLAASLAVLMAHRNAESEPAAADGDPAAADRPASAADPAPTSGNPPPEQ